ncbi:MAG: PhnB protein [Bacteroidia bacterium]|jgi:PhnB protein
MTTINPYLTFNGNCLEAFTFYKSVFGGEFAFIGKFNEMPPQSEHSVNKEKLDYIMHVSLPNNLSSIHILNSERLWEVIRRKRTVKQLPLEIM